MEIGEEPEFVFGSHGGWVRGQESIGIYDGVCLNAAHLEKLSDPIFIEALKKAIQEHDEVLTKEVRQAIATNKIPEPLRLDTTRAIVWIRDGRACRYCRRSLELNEAVAEHVIPKSRGGSNKLTNLVCACNPCNKKKGARTPKQAGMKMALLEVGA